jgi:hypothetical protein
MRHGTCFDPREHLILGLWVMLSLLPLSNAAWAAGTESIPHSLIQHPPVATSPAPKLDLTPSQAQTNPHSIVPHALLRKPTPPSPPLAPATAVPSLSAQQAGAFASSMSGPVPAGTASSSGTHPSSANKTETSRLPVPLQRLFRDNPAFGKLLQVAPPDAPTPPPSPNSAVLSWIANKESDLAGYRIYVGTASGTYNFPGSPFTVGKVTTYTVTDLQQKTTYFFAISAYDIAGNESPLSNEASKSIF